MTGIGGRGGRGTRRGIWQRKTTTGSETVLRGVKEGSREEKREEKILEK